MQLLQLAIPSLTSLFAALIAADGTSHDSGPIMLVSHGKTTILAQGVIASISGMGAYTKHLVPKQWSGYTPLHQGMVKKLVATMKMP